MATRSWSQPQNGKQVMIETVWFIGYIPQPSGYNTKTQIIRQTERRVENEAQFVRTAEQAHLQSLNAPALALWGNSLWEASLPVQLVCRFLGAQQFVLRSVNMWRRRDGTFSQELQVGGKLKCPLNGLCYAKLSALKTVSLEWQKWIGRYLNRAKISL